MNKSLYSLLVGLSFVSLTACQMQDIYGPTANGRGYAHLHKEYRTVIPDRPYFIGDSYTDEEVILSQELWTRGVNELLNELEANSVMNGLSVSLQPALPKNSYDVRMDYYLRKALAERGYLIATEPLETVPVLRYVARLPGYRDGLQQKGRAIDHFDIIDNEFDVQANPKNNGQPYVFMGMEVYDMSVAEPEDRLLLRVETLQTVLEKDIREIRGSLVAQPSVEGPSPTSNILP